VIYWTLFTFHDDGASLDRLTAMKKMTIPLLLATTLGCASDVDLPLDLDRGAELPPTTDPDPPMDPSDPPPDPPDPPPPPADDLVWAKADFPEWGTASDVAWTTDGGLVAAVALHRWVYTPYVHDERVSSTLARYDADGALAWEVNASPGYLFTDVAATPDGGVAVGVRQDFMAFDDILAGGIDWYDASGSLTARWRPTSQETGLEPLFNIYKVQPLPDGGVFWAGMTGTVPDSTGRSAVGLLNAERQLQWVADMSSPVQGDTAAVSDVALAADGDIVVLAYSGHRSWSQPLSYVVEFGADGSEHWETFFFEGKADHVAVTPSGGVIAVGTLGMSRLAAVEDLRLWADYPDQPAYSLELDPAGRPVALQLVELPAAIYGGGDGVAVHDATMRGDELAVTGTYDNGGEYGYFVTTNHLDGGLATEMHFPIRDGQRFGDPGPRAAEVSPDGRLALGGDFSGFVDFGDGEVGSGQDEGGNVRTVPFIAVFETAGAGVD
jgi:hypothetical protein